MAIEKSLYQAPQGIEDLMEDVPEIEIEIEDPESVSIGIDGLEIEIGKEEESEEEFSANLAEYMSEGELSELAGDIEN
jgi:hypothetical protein